MRILEAEQPLIRDLKEESEVLGELPAVAFTVVTARHPTLGRLVLVIGKDGSGVVVETEG